MTIDTNELVALWRSGLSIVECGAKVGCSVGYAHRLLKRAGVPTHERLGSGRRGKSKGRVELSTGYVMLYSPKHPAANPKHPYIFEHRLVMEEHLGRYLLPSEVVHHKNRDRADNRVENLEVFSSNGEHLKEEWRYQWSRKYDRCVECGTTERRHEARGRCHRCHYRRKRS